MTDGPDAGGGTSGGGENTLEASGLTDDGEDFASARVKKDEYNWEDFKEEYFYEDGSPPTNWRGKPYTFDPDEYLGHAPAETGDRLTDAAETAKKLSAYFEGFVDPETTPVTPNEYLWEHFRNEFYYEDGDEPAVRPRDENGEIVEFDPVSWVGHEDVPSRVAEGAASADTLSTGFEEWLDPANAHVAKDEYFWEHFKYQYYYADTSVTPPERPRDDDGEVEEFRKDEWLGFPEENLEGLLAKAGREARELREIDHERTVNVPAELDEDAFFSTVEGHTTLVNRYDLEKTIPMPKKQYFQEIDRYWVNKPYSFVVLFHSGKENETKYYLVEPYCTPIETDLSEFLTGKLRSSIKYSSDEVVIDADEDERGEVIERETLRLLDRYDLYTEGDDGAAEQLRDLLERYDSAKDAIRESVPFVAAEGDGDGDAVAADGGAQADAGGGARAAVDGSVRADENGRVQLDADGSELSDDADEELSDADADELPEEGDEHPDADSDDESATDSTESSDDDAEGSLRRRIRTAVEDRIEASSPDESGGLDGIQVRPEPILLEEDDETLSEYQAEKLLYYLRRDFTGYERIDGIKHDINVEDISCDGYNAPVFVYHTDYEQIITNVYHGEDELDDFVVKMAQRSGKGISKRQPQVDATLPDGSRAQLTLGREVSDHGTNYTIRQFKDVPFTPIDLVNWNTFSLEEMAFLWLAIENHKSLIFAGGTASGKTTSLNAVSLFIPSNTKIVSIEDTREVELPQRNWIASVTRPSFSDDDKGDVDEFDLLEAALRQRPDYIVMGEIRGEEGRTLFQVMSTGHTTYTTFHADTVGEVLKRFTTEPINVSKTLFTALDLVSIQTQTRVQGSKVRRNKSLTEINEYNAENDEINVQDVFQWRAEDDEFMRLSGSNTMEEIMFDRGWDRQRLENEILERRAILAYLIKNGLNEYTQVAATVQAYINDPETILTLVANDSLETSLEDLREMESVHIDIDPEKEEMVPRPDPGEETYALAKGILAEAEDHLFEQYRGADADFESLAAALAEGNAEDEEEEGDEEFSYTSHPAATAGDVEDSVRRPEEGGELGRFSVEEAENPGKERFEQLKREAAERAEETDDAETASEDDEPEVTDDSDAEGAFGEFERALDDDEEGGG